MIFDPFGDFETAGYLRNIGCKKDLDIVKRMEHSSFNSSLEEALDYLESSREITYQTFLSVHGILFGSLYPWAGQDRTVTSPGLAISKGSEELSGHTKFALPNEIKSAAEYGLKLSSNHDRFRANPGEVMGAFAYAHPFLDGNGRTILLVHMELCYRSGFSIDWPSTKKDEYLLALTKEIDDPREKALNKYLYNHIKDVLDREQWIDSIYAIDGLDGLDSNLSVYGSTDDPKVVMEYQNNSRYREDFEP